MDRLQKQLKTDHKKEAEDCLQIYNYLKESNDGHVWESQWNSLVDVYFKDFISHERRYKPNRIGYIFLKGLKQ